MLNVKGSSFGDGGGESDGALEDLTCRISELGIEIILKLRFFYKSCWKDTPYSYKIRNFCCRSSNCKIRNFCCWSNNCKYNSTLFMMVFVISLIFGNLFQQDVHGYGLSLGRDCFLFGWFECQWMGLCLDFIFQLIFGFTCSFMISKVCLHVWFLGFRFVLLTCFSIPSLLNLNDGDFMRMVTLNNSKYISESLNINNNYYEVGHIVIFSNQPY